MKVSKNVYEPVEDSKLLLKNSRKYLKELNIDNFNNLKNLNICEIGVGSGFVISNLAKNFSNYKYFGSDINSSAIKLTKLEFKKLGLNINLKENSLFEGFTKNKKFDLILFNTPYFPFENKFDNFKLLNMKDRAIYGGKKGYEVIRNFIYEINDKLNYDGCAFIIFSTLSKPEQIKKILRQNLFDFEIIEEENSFFEKIICLKFWKTDVLKELNKLNVRNLEYLSYGKHSIVLTGFYKNKESIIKIGKPKYLEKEGFFEKKLDYYIFVPILYLKRNNFVIREMINGKLIKEFLINSNKERIEIVLNNILRATYRLDELKINKFEMTNPYKHIFVQEDLNVKFIDFERCIFSEKPKNTTQVLQYFRRHISLFESKGLILDDKKIFEISKKYKQKNFKFKVKDLM